MDLTGYIVTLIIGIVIVFIGISNVRGNISMLHSYHRARVKEEDKAPFGRLVGIGTIIMGVGLIIFGILSLIAYFVEIIALTWAGIGLMILGFAVGLPITFYAMIKYNHGIF
ncbi:MAG: hypothetical protein J6Q18_00655 [Oscillospiraceae bacterium]|nr:hypothetical protein [Oscillospiraceae bacterium]